MTEPTKETIENEKRKKHLAMRKKYRDTHKEEISEKMRALYLEKREERSERVKCDCGAMVRKDGMHRHVLTAKHQRFLIKTEPNQPLADLEKQNVGEVMRKHNRYYEYVPCQCGGSYRRHNKTNHFWTNQHKRWLKEWMDNCSDSETEEGVPKFRPLLL